MNRRDLLKSAGIAGIGLAGAGMGFGLFAGTADANVASSLSVNDPSAVVSDDGSLLYVEISGSHGVEWDGLDTEATHVRNLKRLTYKVNNKTYDIYDTGIRSITSLGGKNDGGKTGTSGQFKFNFSNRAVATDGNGNYDTRDGKNGNGTDPLSNPAPVAPLEVDADGKSKTRKILLTEEYRLYSGSDKSTRLITDTATDAFKLTVTNEKAIAVVGGQIDTNAATSKNRTDSRDPTA